MRKLTRYLFVVAAISLAVALGLLLYDYLQTQERFPARTLIGKIEVSGLDQKQAFEKLRQYKTSDVFAPAVTFEAETYRFTFFPEAIGIYIDPEKAVRRVFDLTHSQNYLKELRNRLVRGPLHCPPMLGVDEAVLREVVNGMAEVVRSSAKDASLVLFEESGGYHIEPESLGREIQVEETIRAVTARLASGEAAFPLVIKYTAPRITEQILRARPPVYRLAAFTTYYGRHDSPNRIHNIKLIASWLNGTLILPGDEFSLSEAIGEFTPERGFKEAFVIYQGVLVPQLGGGTCQIGTTLYNALQLADLKILQRQNHSFYFNIYPLGRDATVYPGQKDLKFLNDTGNPILIKTVATNRRLSFRIYGTPTGKTVKFSAPAVYLLTEHGYRPSTVRDVLASDRPFKTIVVRTVYDAANNQIKEEVINSFYKLYGEKTNVPIARPEPR